jgi:hypothetical protein
MPSRKTRTGVGSWHFSLGHYPKFVVGECLLDSADCVFFSWCWSFAVGEGIDRLNAHRSTSLLVLGGDIDEGTSSSPGSASLDILLRSL